MSLLCRCALAAVMALGTLAVAVTEARKFAILAAPAENAPPAADTQAPQDIATTRQIAVDPAVVQSAPQGAARTTVPAQAAAGPADPAGSAQPNAQPPTDDAATSKPADNAAKRSSGANCNRAQFRLVLDVGHTVEAPGAMSARGVPEHDFNLRLAKHIERNLLDAGFRRTVLLVTAGPTRRGLVQRVKRANLSSANLFLSIHHDSVPDALLEDWQYEGKQNHFSDRFKGHSIFVSHDNSDYKGSLLFGRLLGNALKARGLQYTRHYIEKIMGHRRRELVDAESGVYRYDQLFVLTWAQMPAVLLEAGSIVNREEEVLLGSEERQALISAAVTDAVEEFCAARSPHKRDQIANRRRATASPQADVAKHR
jgi:N-acetylmuramoyl-L-alanine amidase